ncbi:MAG: molecular chaperone TorD family protein [Rhodospirillales bacterium]|nr:molecular chaperone TorD family protein [Rhodospirillales bacterium]
MASPENNMVEMAIARANVYGLLADVFRDEPSDALLSKLREPEISGALKALNLSLDDVFECTPQEQLVENLALEYTRIFIGPGSHISPHESMHTEARMGEPNALWGEQTVAVKKFMEGAGVTIADSFSGMPDHITAEFEFMQQLLLTECEAWKNGEKELGLNILKIQKRFYDEHLSQWVANFCNKVIKATEQPYFKQFTEVTKGFIELEKETLQELIDEAQEGDRLSA